MLTLFCSLLVATPSTVATDPCAGLELACRNDAICDGMYPSKPSPCGTGQSKSECHKNYVVKTVTECKLNQLCDKLTQCKAPCWDEMSACLTNTACAAAFPWTQDDGRQDLSTCAANSLCRELMRCHKIPLANANEKICYSVGDPHVRKFDGFAFDSHAEGWKTLYAKDDLVIELEQAKWNKNSRAAINRAVRFSTNGGASWDHTLTNGQSTVKDFASHKVRLSVKSSDFSRFSWATHKHTYNVYVITSEYEGATGQCTQGKLRRRLDSSGDTSDGVAFPSGAEVKVSKEQAEEACAGLTEQKKNCVTDMRMMNEPRAIAKIREDFDTVEVTVKTLEVTTMVTSSPPIQIINSVTGTDLCFAVMIAMLVVSVL